MLKKTTGIVLRVVKYRNTSAIIDIFTEAFGLRTYLINGVYKIKPSFPPAAIQLGVVLDIIIYHREGKSINRIKDLKFSWHPNKSLFDIRRIAVKMFIIELTRKLVTFENETQTLFAALNKIMYHLDYSDHSMANIPLFYLVLLLPQLGIEPDLGEWPNKKTLDIEAGKLVFKAAPNTPSIAPALVHHLREIIQLPLDSIHLKSLKYEVRQALTEGLLSYFNYHIDNFSQLHTPEIYKRLL